MRRSAPPARGASMGAPVSCARRLPALLHALLRRCRWRTPASEVARLEDFLRAASDFWWETDRRYRLVYLSPEASRVLGRPISELLGRHLFELVKTVPSAGLDGGMLLGDLSTSPRFVPGRPFRDLRCSFIDPNGRKRILEANAVPICDARGRFCGYRGTAREVSARVRAEGRLRFLAGHDPLTGVANRALLEAAAQSALARARARNRHCGLMLLDLDRFKQVNDAAGHAAGDLVLRIVARRMEETARAGDLVARLGGDEFVLLLAEVEGREELVARRRALEEKLCAPIFHDRHTLAVAASIGIALAPEDGCDLAALLAHADAEMYARKRSRAERGVDRERRLVDAP